MNSKITQPTRQRQERRFNGWQVLAIVLAVILATVVVTAWAVRSYFFAGEFKPVTLSAKEETVLDDKLQRFGFSSSETKPHVAETEGEPLEPRVYSEKGLSRDINLTERELNALLANNTNLAKRLAVDLSEDLASARLLVPMDQDFPLLGGKTLKLSAGMELAYANGRPVVILKGVTIMGVPIPNAWLGNIKNVDLIREFGANEGFWNAFSAGVKNIRVEEGKLKIELKE